MAPDTTSDADDSHKATWPSREACAAELAAVTGRNVTTRTISRWVSEYKLNIPRQGPIRKAAIIAWAHKDLPPAHRPKSDKGNAEDDLRSLYLQEQIRNLQAKNEVLEGTRIDAGVVSRGLLAACASLKTILDGDLPIRFVEAIRSLSVESAVDEIRRMQREAVNRFCAECHENVGAKIVPEE